MVMVPIIGMSGKLETLAETPPAIMENGNSVKSPEERMMICSSNCEDNTFDEAATVAEEKRIMTCTNNSEDNTFHTEESLGSHYHTVPSKDTIDDVEVDIVGEPKPDEERMAERESQNVTESSSSFGSTDSGAGSAAGSSDVEVESQVQDDNASLLRFDGFSHLFGTRKKKVTARWRKFVRPVMWRCKWVELQLRELQSQVSKYDTELAECDRKKQCELERDPTEDLGIKSVPFISQNRSVKLMKRKKRKRVEETVDLASYTSSHSVFSYYASKRPVAGSACIDDDHNNHDVNPVKKTPFGSDEFGIAGGWTAFESKDSNAFEIILRKIDEGQLQVHLLRTRMDKVVREHAGKFTSNCSSFAHDDPSANCAPNSALPHVNIEKTPFTSVCATSQRGHVTPLPDMVESTDQPRIDGKCEQTGNGILTFDQPVKEELNNTEEAEIQRAESPLATKGEAGNVQNIVDPDSASQMPVTREQSAVKTRSISKLVTPKNKRKRGRRKARSGRWNRRSSG